MFEFMSFRTFPVRHLKRLIVSACSVFGSAGGFVNVLEDEVPNNGLKNASTLLFFFRPVRPRAKV